MERIFSNVKIEILGAMRVASYCVISDNPEEESIAYIKNWMNENGLADYEDARFFGFNVPVGEEEEKEGQRGYEYWAKVPEEAELTGGVVIKHIPEGQYAVMRITEPFVNPFETIPEGWRKLYDWIIKNDYKIDDFEERRCLEEVIENEQGVFMDIYIPIL